MAKHNKKQIYLNDDSLALIGDRPVSQTINIILHRIAHAATTVGIGPDDLAFIDANKDDEQKAFGGGGYPDQSITLSQFSNHTGRSVSESIVVLDKIDRDVK